MQEIERETKNQRMVMLLSLIGALLVLLALYFFARPALIHAKPVNNSGLVKFSFERVYSDGSSLKMTMKRADGQARVMVYDSSLGGKRELMVDEEALLSLQQLLVDSGVYRWDGFYERAPSLQGDNTFSMTITYVDGQDVTASGVNMLPSDIDQGTQALKAFFFAALVH